MNEPHEPVAMRRARLVVAYDGAPFRGFAEAPEQRTVMGDLRAVLQQITRVPLELVGAGRTDAGVHGWGQVVSGDLPAGFDLAALARRVNRMCAPDIVVRSARWADDPEFSARFSASWRRYRYHVWNAPTPVPALAATAWHVPQPLALWAMQLACDPIIGEHDFASFCRRPKPMADPPPGWTEPTLRRRVLDATWRAVPSEWGDGLLRFEIRANAFCHQMVRSITGTMIDVGLGKLHAGELTTILAAKDRLAAGRVAPPHGLVLWEVGYPDS